MIRKTYAIVREVVFCGNTVEKRVWYTNPRLRDVLRIFRSYQSGNFIKFYIEPQYIFEKESQPKHGRVLGKPHENSYIEEFGWWEANYPTGC